MARRSTTSALSPCAAPSSRTATISTSTTRGATRWWRWRRGPISTLVTRSPSRTGIRLARASTWPGSPLTWASCTTPQTRPTRRRARSVLEGSAIAEWIRRMRRLSRWRDGSFSGRTRYRADNADVIVRVVVRAGAVVYLPAWVAALDLNRRVPDGKSIAKSLLQVAHDMFSLPKRAVVNHHVNAQRHLVR